MPPASTDHALMLLPYDEWISIPTAARRAQLDEGTTTKIVRAGRRRGVLRTRGEGEALEVMRVHPGPRRRATPRRRPSGSGRPTGNGQPHPAAGSAGFHGV
ncbi:hypothetical protein [Streptomyces sp. NPDC020965]|uniref:hypothetical protein n=1 Tax=Streptomyces sp. NPDC020965 TaxID=3365105 RepID=UPI00379A8036